MASREVPGIGLRAEWDFRETAWKTGMDDNLRRLSLLVQLRVNSFVTALPGSPVQGQRHILVNTESPFHNHIAVWDLGLWSFYPPEPNFMCINMATHVIHMYVPAFGGWAEMTSPQAIKDSYESNPNTNAFTDALLTKLNGIEDGARAAMSDEDVKAAYERNLNTNEFTDAEKAKLAGLSASRFLGTYVSLTALRAAHPSPPSGSFAYVDSGTNADIMSYIWDATDLKYVPQASGNTQETPESVKAKYEANADTNAFTDAEKLKLEAYDPDAPALPSGGSIGQMLVKTGVNDGEAGWQNPPPVETGIPDGGLAGQVLTKQSNDDGDVFWAAGGGGGGGAVIIHPPIEGLFLTNAEWGPNLVINGGFEEATLTGWTVSAGSFSFGIPGNGSGNNQAATTERNGAYFLAAGSVAMASAYQDFLLEADHGMSNCLVSFDSISMWTDTDSAFLRVTFYDLLGTIILTERLGESFSGYEQRNYSKNFEGVSQVRRIRLEIELARNNGTNNDCGIDNIRLQVGKRFSSLPDYSGKAGQSLKVNSLATGLEWAASDTTVMQINSGLTLGLVHAQKYIRSIDDTALNITIPAHSAVPFGLETTMVFRQVGLGRINFVAASGVTLTHVEMPRTRKQHSTVTLIKVGENLWELFGDLDPIPV